MKDLSGYLVSAMKKRAIEISERRMTPQEKIEFGKAKNVEVTNFLSAKAFEALPEGYRAKKEDAIRMRWILTWKSLPNGGSKAKARAVLLGYMDSHYEQRATASPTTTRQTRQIQLTIAASKGFTTHKGDVTGAFLQSRQYPEELLCIPCPEILEAMGLPAETITRVKKACYGLVDAPLEWYRSVSSFFNQLKLKRCWADPCCWTFTHNNQLEGIISGHVDDFVFSGNESSTAWQSVLAAIKQEYKWTDWESGTFVQCGVKVEAHSDGSYSLSQESYVEDLKYINIRAHRKKDKRAATDDHEKGQLRALLGGVSWHAQQVAPHFSAETGLLLSEVTKSTVDTLNRANKLMHQVKTCKEHRLWIPKLDSQGIGLFAWCDAAAQNRVDGGSTQGIFIGAASVNLLTGQSETISPILWQSSKIQRVCRSPGAAEAVAAVNAQDSLFFARFQFAEMLGQDIDVRQINRAVNSIPGCVITDSRNVFDKTSSEVVCTKGHERRTDLDMLSLKYAQHRNGVKIRWVHSEAQLANSLTKHEMKQLMMFYDMKQRWKIVKDIHMSSARKRKEQGLEPLQDTATAEDHIQQQSQQQNNIDSLQ